MGKMSEIKKIRVEIYKPGEGYEAHEWEYCPIMQAIKRDISPQSMECPINGVICTYGLTTIEPPESCPIKNGLEMKFTIV